METTLAVALVIPWVFWGSFMGLLIAAGRSWINLLLIAAGTTVVILAAATLSSIREAFWASLILHLFLLFYFLKSYISFAYRDGKKKRR